MGMTADKLGVEVFGDVAEVEVTGFRGHLCVEKDLQEEVAEFVLEVGPGAAFDGVEDLIGLFEGVALDTVEGLLAVPGTAVGPAQSGHDGGGALESLRGRRLRFFPIDYGTEIHAFRLPEVAALRSEAARPRKL